MIALYIMPTFKGEGKIKALILCLILDAIIIYGLI